jgi:hypothetical protein
MRRKVDKSFDFLRTCIVFFSTGVGSKNLKIKIYRTIILPYVCMGVKLGRSH